MLAEQPTTPREVCYKLVEGKPGYRVGDDGSVWSRVEGGCHPRLGMTWKRLKPSPQYRGHLCLCLGRKDYRFVHRLVLEAFVGPCPEGMECLHGDGNPGNNFLSNLRWGTRLENYQDSLRHGTAYLVNNAARGEEHVCAKLTPVQVKHIMKHRANGLSAVKICKALGIPAGMRGAVNGVYAGQSWNHITGLPPYRPQSSKPGPRKRQGAPNPTPSDNLPASEARGPTQVLSRQTPPCLSMFVE